jgi:hypothetical protein
MAAWCLPSPPAAPQLPAGAGVQQSGTRPAGSSWQSAAAVHGVDRAAGSTGGVAHRAMHNAGNASSERIPAAAQYTSLAMPAHISEGGSDGTPDGLLPSGMDLGIENVEATYPDQFRLPKHKQYTVADLEPE